jgi:hypothetical protein
MFDLNPFFADCHAAAAFAGLRQWRPKRLPVTGRWLRDWQASIFRRANTIPVPAVMSAHGRHRIRRQTRCAAASLLRRSAPATAVSSAR